MKEVIKYSTDIFDQLQSYLEEKAEENVYFTSRNEDRIEFIVDFRKFIIIREAIYYPLDIILYTTFEVLVNLDGYPLEGLQNKHVYFLSGQQGLTLYEEEKDKSKEMNANLALKTWENFPKDYICEIKLGIILKQKAEHLTLVENMSGEYFTPHYKKTPS